MTVSKSMVGLAVGRLVSIAFDAAVLSQAFPLSTNNGVNAATMIVAAFIGGITNFYEFLALFDPSGSVSLTPMVALGDVIAVAAGIAGVAVLAVQNAPPPGADWTQKWHAAIGVACVDIIIHAALAAGRVTMHLYEKREVIRALEDPDGRKRSSVDAKDTLATA